MDNNFPLVSFFILTYSHDVIFIKEFAIIEASLTNSIKIIKRMIQQSIFNSK